MRWLCYKAPQLNISTHLGGCDAKRDEEQKFVEMNFDGDQNLLEHLHVHRAVNLQLLKSFRSI